ncbi:MAG: SRPBCC family protein [Sciscionella sp.]|nr:SRPBCC family protein [Sciscionella sp.]
MQTVRVKKTIDAPIDDVFDAYTDHEALALLPIVRSAKLIKTGHPERNGLGAIREVDGGVVWLREEITRFDRPRRMEYRIVKSRPPSDHRLGRVEFAENADGGTEIIWTSVFGIPVPGVGIVVEPGFRLAFEVIFRLVLRSVAQRATAKRSVA